MTGVTLPSRGGQPVWRSPTQRARPSREPPVRQDAAPNRRAGESRARPLSETEARAAAEQGCRAMLTGRGHSRARGAAGALGYRTAPQKDTHEVRVLPCPPPPSPGSKTLKNLSNGLKGKWYFYWNCFKKITVAFIKLSFYQ